MPVINGVGCKRVRTISSPSGEKNYLKVKEATDLSVKNYINVVEVAAGEKDCINVLKVTYDNPKDYIMVNYVQSERQYYNFDGGDDYVSIPQADLVNGDTLTVSFISGVSGQTGALVQLGGSSRVYMNSNGTITINMPHSSATLDGVPFVSGDTYPLDGEAHTITVNISGSTSIDSIGGANPPRVWDTAIFNVGLSLVSGDRLYSLGDGWSENPVVRDSIGGKDGIAMNFQESGWFTA